ncbi:4Fe-4S double cluster binding domain-containing protein [candidate division KSB1 bacterium]
MLINLKNLVESLLPDKANYIFGFADLTGLLNEKYRGFDHAVVIGKKLDSDIIDRIADGPTLDYYEHYNAVNNNLLDTAEKIAEGLRAAGAASTTVRPTFLDSEIDDDYYKTLTTDFSHKMAATRAGLGWIGKTDLLISEKFGPGVRFAAVLTDFPLENIYPPVNKSKCGKCSICVDRCPADAANGELWDIDVFRDEFYDPFKCRDKARELTRKNFGKEVSLCGICISVCPVGKKQ